MKRFRGILLKFSNSFFKDSERRFLCSCSISDFKFYSFSISSSFFRFNQIFITFLTKMHWDSYKILAHSSKIPKDSSKSFYFWFRILLVAIPNSKDSATIRWWNPSKYLFENPQRFLENLENRPKELDPPPKETVPSFSIPPLQSAPKNDISFLFIYPHRYSRPTDGEKPFTSSKHNHIYISISSTDSTQQFRSLVIYSWYHSDRPSSMRIRLEAGGDHSFH